VIGEKIRSIRKNKNLTIVELSEQINVTSGYISQIERDLISPSLTVLKRLAEALDIPLSVLFLDESSENVVAIPVVERTKVKFGNINIELEYITPVLRNNEKASSLEAFYFKLPAKSWVSENTIIMESKEVFYVLNGEIECHIGDKVYCVSAGGSICLPENIGHMVYNSTDMDAEAICMVAPSTHL
jgi:transcriptional regulator with XRE-family HTH domain